jgi:regulator of sigma D
MIYEDGKYSDSQLTEYKLPFSAKMDFKTDELEKIMDKARIEMNQDFYDMTSKKKKEIYILSQPKVVRNYQQTLKDYSTLFFQSIYKKVIDDIKSEDW